MELLETRCTIAWNKFRSSLRFKGKYGAKVGFETARELSLSLSLGVLGRGDISTQEAGEIDLLGGGKEFRSAVTRSKPRDNLEENAARRREEMKQR